MLLALGDTAVMEAGKATVFSGSKGEPRDNATRVCGVQWVGRGAEAAVGAAWSGGVSGES